MEAILMKIGTWGLGFIGTAAGASIILRLVNRIPLGPWLFLCEKTAATISRIGNMRIGRLLYEPFETWFQNALTETVKAINRGVDKDDQPPATQEGKNV